MSELLANAAAYHRELMAAADVERARTELLAALDKAQKAGLVVEFDGGTDTVNKRPYIAVKVSRPLLST